MCFCPPRRGKKRKGPNVRYTPQEGKKVRRSPDGREIAIYKRRIRLSASSPSNVGTSLTCDHGVINLKPEDDGNYFSTRYLENRPQAPRKCHQCAKGFGAEYKVSVSRPVYLCRNARRPEGECGYALCAPCYQKKLSEDSCMAGGRRGSCRRPTKRNLYKVSK